MIPASVQSRTIRLSSGGRVSSKSIARSLNDSSFLYVPYAKSMGATQLMSNDSLEDFDKLKLPLFVSNNL